MADHTDEEHPDDPIKTHSENPTDKTPPAADTEVISQKQEPENMEVHHHAHDPAAPHHKKNWKSYFWEFLMLFLAVFCGFLAEYQLEHMIENERGKQYMQSFVEDLKYDTTSLSFMTKAYKAKVEKLNIISSCYDSIISNQSCNSCLADLFVNSQAFWQLDVSDRTLQQLKNAGGLRLLKKADADSVTAYDNIIKGYQIDETTAFQETQTALRTIMNELFDYSAFRNVGENNFEPSKVQFVSTDKILLNKYFNTLARYRRYCVAYIRLQEKIKERATGLIASYTKKYHFE